MDFYYVHGGIQRFNYSYVRDKDNVNKNAVAGQTDKMWFKQGDENKTYWTPFYTSSTAEDNKHSIQTHAPWARGDYLRPSMVSMRYRLPAATLHKILPFMRCATVGFRHPTSSPGPLTRRATRGAEPLPAPHSQFIHLKLNLTF